MSADLAAATSLRPQRPHADSLTVATPYDVERIRRDFPILSRVVHGDRPLVYLDNAATSQSPQAVLHAERDYYERHNANVHRGIHVLAEEATALYEGARDKVAAFIGAYDRHEVVFTKNASEGINLVAHSLGSKLQPGDEVVISEMEHHSNIVPWQLLCQRTGATLKWFGITDDGRLDLADDVITERTKIVALVHQSNILGTVNPVTEVVARAHAVGAQVLLDGCQSVPNSPISVRGLGIDFLAFSGHKMCGPTGIGVLWGRRELLAEMPPFLGGGEMIEVVTMEGSTYAEPPHRFEAGTPPISQAIGLGAAVDYLSSVGMDAISAYEHELTTYALSRFADVDGLRVIGPPTAQSRGAAISFALGDLHPHDVGQVLDEQGIAVRVGHHCARPVCQRFGVPATTRASFYLYTTRSEIDALVEGLDRVKAFFGI
jgi:cysteine desulfurase / selenocysteine lyase